VVKFAELFITASSSLADLDPNLLRQMLGYAQPHEHHHRFEWSGLVGRTCRIFHQLSRDDSNFNQGVSIDLNEFEKYRSTFPTTSRSRDLRLALLQRLVKDETMRARA